MHCYSYLRFGIHKFPGTFLSFEKFSNRFLTAAGLAEIGELKKDNADIPKKYNSQVIFSNSKIVFLFNYFCHVVNLQ